MARTITVNFKHVGLQFVFIVFFVLIWLNSPLWGVNLSIMYFLFMFGFIVLFSVIIIYFTANKDIPIPKEPTQKFANLAKAIVDGITDELVKKHVIVDELKSVMMNAVIWSLRDAEISDKIDKETIQEAKTYINEKLFPTEKIDIDGIEGVESNK